MSITVVVKLKVEDYGKFEASFATRKTAREAAGLQLSPYRDIDDANSVVVLGTVSSKEAFIGFLGTPERQEAMQNATIQGPPEIIFLEG